jgi:isopenicillin-N epimerase
MPSSSFAALWTLDPGVEFLNHGSFGAAPRAVLEAQTEWRARLERQPVQFFRELERHLDAARATLGAFVGADPDDLAFVSNASSGVNTVVRSLQLQPGDELLTTDHAYNACRNALRLHEPRGVRVVIAQVPFPLRSPGQVVEAVLARATPRTRLVLLDHVTSPTGLVFPVAELVRALSERGIDTLVDGAHAPGMVPLDLRTLGAAYYTGNCHKWLCAPKGSAFLHVRRDRQDGMLPLTIGHGFNSTRTDRSRFRLLFDWTGTADPTPFLCIPAALECLGSLLPGGWPELMRRNHALALSAQGILGEALGIERPAPSEMIGSLAAVPLPPLGRADVAAPPAPPDPLQRALLSRHGIEVPVMAFSAPPARVLRVAAQVYNSEEQVHALAAALRALLAETPHG